MLNIKHFELHIIFYDVRVICIDIPEMKDI